MSHYYTNDNNLRHEDNTIFYTYKGKKIVLKSDAGIFSKERIDFGTNILINNIDVQGSKILDIGCGYGAVGVIIGSANDNLEITFSDVNERALEMAKINCISNNIKNYKIVKSDGYENLGLDYDLIISNPPIRAGKDVVDKIVLGAKEHLTKSGKVYVVIQKKQGALSLIDRMKKSFGNVEIICKEKGYFIICGQK